MSTPAPRPYDVRRLSLATLGALGVAALVLVLAVLPAEYGIDPTGFGDATGLTKIHAKPSVVVTNATPSVDRTTYAFDARLTLSEREVYNHSEHIDRFRTQHTLRVPLNVTNLTRVRAELTWSAPAGSNKTGIMEISIRAPQQRESDLAQGDAGFANASLQWRASPFPREENGTLVLVNETDASSFGEWRFVVRLYTNEDRDYTLRVLAESFALDASVEGTAADKVTLTLEPHGQVEYKFAMQPNATLTYRWNATAVIHSDLHSDHFEDPEDVLETKIAELDHDAGTYTASYYGRHGWYWRNDHAFPVTITLETRGDYQIIGVPH